MNKIMFFLLVLFGDKAIAECPKEMIISNQSYCSSLVWQPSQQKKSGALLDTQDKSPFLNKTGHRPHQWHFSAASFKLWLKNDSKERSVHIKQFRIFPYMQMLGGAHHGASYQFVWDPQAQEYRLFDFSLTEMEGCWSLRWTLDENDDLPTSQELVQIDDYTNLTPEENFSMATLCSRCSSSPLDETNESEHQHEMK